MTDLAALQARAKALVAELQPRHERPIPFCPHTPTPAQKLFLGCYALSALYGGAAGGGKSDALLMAALMYVDVPGYAALILRRTYADLALPGAIMDRAKEWLAGTAATWSEKDKRWTFPSGATLTFGYCETDSDVYRYQGSEFQFIGIDELTQWSERAFRYLLSRLRRLVGVDIPLRMRAGTNPGGVGHAWVKAYFVEPGHPDRPFFPAKLEDNPHLDREAYEAALAQLDEETRNHLRHGLWTQDPEGLVYRYDRAKNRVAALPVATGWQVTFAIDYGSAETTATSAFSALWWRPHDTTIYVERAWCEGGLIGEDFAERVTSYTEKIITPGHGVLFSLVSDEGALGQAFGREMRKRHGLGARPAKKSDKSGFRKLFNGEMQKGRIVLVDGQCTALEAEFDNLRWNPARTDSMPGQPDHASDATLYGWRDAQGFRATAKPDAEPVYGSPEWHAARAKAAEDAAYGRARVSAAKEARGETWERW